jgi:hypothetical protein
MIGEFANMNLFDEWWKDLPPAMKKGDRVRARTRYERIAKDGELEALHVALELYVRDQTVNSWRAYSYASTWLGSASNPRWKEWWPTDYVPPLLKVHGHHCESCDNPHAWQCEQPEVCGMPRNQTCPEFAGRYSR